MSGQTDSVGTKFRVQPLVETIDRLRDQVKALEEQVRVLTAEDWMVKLLMTIPGCGEISARTIRAYTDDIGRFANAKKYTAYAGLVPWVRDSNETVHHGKITKRGPGELRTALVQVVMGMRRLKKTTPGWRLMERYEAMKKSKGSGKSITAAARKAAVIIWHMLSEKKEFDAALMAGGNREKEPETAAAALAKEAASAGKDSKPGRAKSGGPRITEMKKPGVTGKKKKKVG